jgi:uncharacterized protein YecE (DUF72 family)
VIYVGTSGYSFRDWVGPFYPPGTRPAEMLAHYVRRFPAVEINSTYYRLPSPETMSRMEKKTPPRFRFIVKFQSEITHRRNRDPDPFRAFREVIRPLEETSKFHGALAQFPWSFRNTEENRGYLEFLRDHFPDRPVFFEFRHDSWATRETAALLRRLDAGFCTVDEPRLRGLFPPLVHVSGEVGYVRLHGRNAEAWWGGGSERYNYLYNEGELAEWAEKIREMASRTRDTFVFFNNCHAGRAVQNAKRMTELLQLEL